MKLFTRAEVLAEIRSRITYENTQKELAQIVGVARAYLSEILSGKRIPAPEFLERFGYEVRFIKKEHKQ